MKIILLLLLSVSLCLGGCVSAGKGLKDVLSAMASDNAAINATLDTPYGRARVTRVMPTSNTVVTITSDGTITVRSTVP